MILVGKPEGNRQLGIPRRRRIILKWILERQNWVVWTELMWLSRGLLRTRY
jgi:hypothetical protein